MKFQKWLILATLVLSVRYFALTVSKINWSEVAHLHSANLQGFLGISRIGLGWVNSVADCPC